jgi:hypothetical protein
MKKKQAAADRVRGATHAEYALHRGLVRSRITQLARAGKLVMAPGGGIDIPGSDARLDAEPKPRKHPEYMQALARKTSLQADRLALDLTKRRGELISAEEAFDFWAFTVSNLKSRLRGLPTRLASQLAFEARPAGCQALLLREIDALLNEMVETVEKWEHWPNGKTLEEQNDEEA